MSTEDGGEIGHGVVEDSLNLRPGWCGEYINYNKRKIGFMGSECNIKPAPDLENIQKGEGHFITRRQLNGGEMVAILFDKHGKGRILNNDEINALIQKELKYDGIYQKRLVKLSDIQDVKKPIYKLPILTRQNHAGWHKDAYETMIYMATNAAQGGSSMGYSAPAPCFIPFPQPLSINMLLPFLS